MYKLDSMTLHGATSAIKAATLYTSKGPSRAAPRTSSAGSEAMLVDGLLFALVSSGATLTKQNFQTGKVFPHFFRHVASQEPYYSSISVLLA